MKTRGRNQFIFWSNAFFVIPFFFALSYHVYIHALVIGVATTISCIYHLYREKKLFRVDRVTAWLLMLTNLALIWSASFPLFYTVITFSTAAIAVYFHSQKKRGPLYHGLWHAASSIVTLFSLLAYVL